MIKPLYIGQVGGQPLRFFKTPLDDGRPDLAWHCVDDLQRCLGLNRHGGKIFLNMLRSHKEYRVIVQTVATADGIITLAPHFMAQGTIEAMIEASEALEAVRTEYDHAGVEAMRKIAIPFPFPSDEYLDWMKAAMNRWQA